MPRAFVVFRRTQINHLSARHNGGSLVALAVWFIVASSQLTEGAITMKTTGSSNALGNYSKEFQAYLERQFYQPFTIVDYDRCLAALSGKMAELAVGLKDLDEATAVDLIGKTDLPPHRAKHRQFMVRSFVRFLLSQGVGKRTPELIPANTELGRLKRAYEEYLRRQRGVSERTIFHSWRIADRFLKFRFGDEFGDLAEIKATDISAFLQHATTRTPPLRDKTLSSHLRNFFRYLFKAEKTRSNLATGIPSVAQRYGARLPRHLTPEQVDALLQAIQSDTPSGRRNYAMVLLIARLGLRASEVIAIQVDDIHWRSGEIMVRGKGKLHDRVPLPPDVGEALTAYIKQDRTTTSRALFVTDRAPHAPFKDGQVLNMILRSAFAKTGLKPPAPYVGSHILRHSLATKLVQRGAPLEEIGDMLRHRSRASTMIYAKLDLNGLRSIALPWPVAGGAR
jgi:site-specific recombinase XerD